MLHSRVTAAARVTPVNPSEGEANCFSACEKMLPENLNTGQSASRFQEADDVDVFVVTASGFEGRLARRNSSIRRNYPLYNLKDKTN